MKRIEIYLSEAIDDDFGALLAKYNILKFSKLNPTMGQGNTTPMLDNDVWPGRNTTFIIYTDNEEPITKAIAELREKFPKEGIAAYLTLCTEI